MYNAMHYRHTRTVNDPVTGSVRGKLLSGQAGCAQVLGRLRRASKVIQPRTRRGIKVEQADGHRLHPAGVQAPVPATPQTRPCDTITGPHRISEENRLERWAARGVPAFGAADLGALVSIAAHRDIPVRTSVLGPGTWSRRRGGPPFVGYPE